MRLKRLSDHIICKLTYDNIYRNNWPQITKKYWRSSSFKLGQYENRFFTREYNNQLFNILSDLVWEKYKNENLICD